MIQVTIDGKGYEYPENCSYYEIAKDFEKTMDAPIVLVKVDGRLRELHKQLKKKCELEFVTTKDEIGHKTYQRSLSLLLVKAVYHVGGYDKIRHVMLHFSAGSGFFYTVDGDITLNQAFLDEVKDRLKKSALGMSGGQQQRLCIARALAVEPEVLLMDEPTSALDPISTSKIEELAMELKGKYTIVIVTHNMQQATRISDKTAFFLLGEVVEFSDTDTLFSMPKDKRTEDYITGRFG